MLVVSYDISNDKLRTKFSKMLIKHGGIRLQFSVFEINNSKRILDNLKVIIETDFGKKFDGGDSVFIFETNLHEAIKYGNAIHRDKSLLYFT
ncbi:MAG: CRISPR-associated endonuclease Cas2 [Paludibacter sp.]|nr:CRISPR-associated endonuclease Cas2 [Paludibacter sp.]